jgi:hypothetical protein
VARLSQRLASSKISGGSRTIHAHMNFACINVEEVSCFVVAGLPSCSRFSFPSRAYPESSPGRVWRSLAPRARTRRREPRSKIRRSSRRRPSSGGAPTYGGQDRSLYYLSLTIAIAAAVETVKRAVGDVVRSNVFRRAANEIARPADLLPPLACLGPSAGRTW